MSPSVQLLGPPRLRGAEGEFPLPVDKVSALLAYLAVRGSWVSRDRLATLLWGEMDDTRARANLRQTLYLLRRQLDGVESERGRVRLAIDSDVDRFRAAVAADDEAALAFEGDLLEGFERLDAPGFQTWLAEERTSLRQRWTEQAQLRLGRLEREGAWEGASALAERFLERDPLAESALQTLLRAAERLGTPERAVAAYRAFHARLESDLGLEPLEETERLLAALRSGSASASAASLPPGAGGPPAAFDKVPGAAPTYLTPFIGRDLELAEISYLLGQEDCRLLTLLGPGGMGKTRLAVQLLHEREARYPDGVAFVALAPLDGVEAVPPALLAALGAGPPERDPLGQLVAALRGRRTLLMLDNAEHLAEGLAPLLRELLLAAPGLQLLVTSRQRLRLRAEWIFDVAGLGVDGGDPEAFAASDAVQLLVRTARRTAPRFRLDDGNRDAVLRICRAVSGMPLGLELAAGWLRALSAEQVAARIESGLGFLESDHRDTPDRHRSLDGVFAGAWELLTPDEREALLGVAPFHDGFDAPAAERVGGVGDRDLAGLVDKALLTRLEGGRYLQHAVVRRHARERLRIDPDRWEDLTDAHARHYLERLIVQGEALKGEGQMAAMAALRTDLANVLAAWRRAVARGWAGPLGRAVEPLGNLTAMIAEGRSAAIAFTEALSVFGGDGSALEGRLLLGRGLVRLDLGDREGAQADLEGARTLLAVSGLDRELAMALSALAVAREQGGDFDGALALHASALERLDGPGNAWTRAAALKAQGGTFRRLGRLDEGERCNRACLEIYRRLGDRFRSSAALGNLGLFASERGDQMAALRYGGERYRLARELDDLAGMAVALNNMATASGRLGENDACRRYLEESLELKRRIGNRRGVALALKNLGTLAAMEGELDRSEAHLAEAIAEADAIGFVPLALDAVDQLAQVAEERGLGERSLALALFVAGREGADDRIRRKAAERAARLERALPQGARKRAADVAARLDFGEVLLRLGLPPVVR